MRHLLGLFGVNEDIKEAFNLKVKETQEKGWVGRDFETKINGKKIKMYLPADVREQYVGLLYAETFLLKDLVTSLDIEPLYKNRMDIFNMATKNMLVDGKDKFDINEFDVEMIDVIILLYVTELLLPLYQRSSTKAEEVLRQNLNLFIAK